MVIRDLEYLDIVSDSKEATGIVGGAKAWFSSKSWSGPFSTSNYSTGFAKGTYLAVAAGTSGSTYAAGAAGVFSTSGGTAFAFGI
ncbi:hypothetical protein ACKFKF_28750 [Phormidesmis sp. 146-12]